MTDVLMSIKPPYVDMLVSGRKTVEIRKRPVRIPAGARIWIYATSPRRKVVASARLEAVAVEAPGDVWRTFGDRTGIRRPEFDAYVGEADTVAALTLAEISELDAPLCLRSPGLRNPDPRGEAPAFRPPQSYAFLHDTGLLAALEAASAGNGRAQAGTPTNAHLVDGTELSSSHEDPLAREEPVGRMDSAPAHPNGSP